MYRDWTVSLRLCSRQSCRQYNHHNSSRRHHCNCHHCHRNCRTNLPLQSEKQVRKFIIVIVIAVLIYRYKVKNRYGNSSSWGIWVCVCLFSILSPNYFKFLSTKKWICDKLDTFNVLLLSVHSKKIKSQIIPMLIYRLHAGVEQAMGQRERMLPQILVKWGNAPPTFRWRHCL